eukprot:scaffold2098_cov270-Chaetoceros_neogracile.AAC.16
MASFASFLRTLGVTEDTQYIRAETSPREAFQLARSLHAPDWNACYDFLSKNTDEDLDVKLILHIVCGIDAIPVTLAVVSDLVARNGSVIHVDPPFMVQILCLNPNVRTEVVNLFLKQLDQSQEDHPPWSDAILTTAIRMYSAGAVRCIVRCYPKTLTMTNAIGLGPLHLSLSYGSDASKTKRILKILLLEEKRNGICSVLKATCDFENCESLSRPIDLYAHKKYKPNIPMAHCKDEWDCLSLCVKAVKEKDKSFNIAHFLLCWRPTSRNFFTAVIQYFDLSLESEDKDGRTLLVASLLEYTQARATNVRQLLHLGADCKVSIGVYTDLRGETVKNRLMLHIALDSPCTKWELLQSIFEKNANALNQRDPMTGLYPFMQASCNKDLSLENIYRLIRIDPNVITICASGGRLRTRFQVVINLAFLVANMMIVLFLTICFTKIIGNSLVRQDLDQICVWNMGHGARFLSW